MATREYHKWHSKRLGRDMELIRYGHAGALTVVFPTSNGRFWDWEDRGMMNTLGQHLDNGWLQVACVDSVDGESWWNGGVSPNQKAERHLQYQEYIADEVLPWMRDTNKNPYTIGMGASWGAYHAVAIAARYPHLFNRAVGLSGLYTVNEFIGGDWSEAIHKGSPIENIRCAHDPKQLELLKKVDWIIAIGKGDTDCYPSNKQLSDVLWEKGIWHAFREWDGFAHDWPVWHDMVLRYVGGADSQQY